MASADVLVTIGRIVGSSSQRDGITRADIAAAAGAVDLERGRWQTLLDEVTETVRTWPQAAAEVGVDEDWAAAIGAQHRLDLPTG